MENRYFLNGSVDISNLRHDLEALLLPFEMSLRNLDNAEKRSQAIAMQAEIYTLLEKIVDTLGELPASAETASRKPEAR